MISPLDLFLHIDKHLAGFVAQYGSATYGLLATVLFCETGLVVTPFLPGDSLLFAAGALAATGALHLGMLLPLLALAAVAGDNLNYWIGRAIGPKVFAGEHGRFFNREHLAKTQAYYDRYGGKTLVIARFVPIVRTFAPFVAGVGQMPYPRFLAFSVGGGLAWIAIGLLAGQFFGNIPIVKEHFSLAILAVVAVSLLPALVEYLRHKRARVALPAGSADH